MQKSKKVYPLALASLFALVCWFLLEILCDDTKEYYSKDYEQNFRIAFHTSLHKWRIEQRSQFGLWDIKKFDSGDYFYSLEDAQKKFLSYKEYWEKEKQKFFAQRGQKQGEWKPLDN